MKLAFIHTLSHSVLPFTGKPHTLFVLLETNSSSHSQPLPMNLSLVIDCSDSMRILMVTNEQFNQLAKSGSIVEVITDGVPAWKIQDMTADQLGNLPRRIDYVVEALRVVSDRIRAIDHYSLIAFAQYAQTIIPTTTGKERQRLAQAANQLDYLSLGNETDMAAGMEKALEQIKSSTQPGMATRMVVLTDGYTKNASGCYTWAQEARKAGISLTTMGMGNEFNEELLIPLADITGGHSYFIERPEQVVDAFKQEMGSALSIKYRNMDVKLKMTPGVELHRVFRVLPSLGRFDSGPGEEGSYSLYIGDFDPTDPPAFLLEMQIPAWNAGSFRAANMLLTCDNPEADKPRLTFRADAVVEISDQGVEHTNPRVLALIEKAQTVELGTIALQEAQAGNVQGATIKLRQAATRLLGMGETDLGNTMMFQANALEQQGSLNSEAAKRLRYETRKITRKLEE